MRKPFDLLLFGIILLFILIFLPVSNYGHHSMRAWGDQSLILHALRQMLSNQTPDSVANGWLGPGYLSLAYIVKYLFALSPENALILLNRLSYIGTVLLLYFSGYVLLTRHTSTYLPGLTSFIYSMFLAIGSIFFGFSDIPWTHFIATFLVMFILFITLFQTPTITIHQLFLCYLQGCLVCLLTQVRLHDSLIFLSCCLLCCIFTHYFQLKNRILFYKTMLITITVFIVGFAITLFLIYHLNRLDELSFNYFTYSKHDPSFIDKSTLYFHTFPYKFVQLFIDPLYYSWDPLYRETRILLSFQDIKELIHNPWKMPIFLQAPAFLYLFVLSSIVIVTNMKHILHASNKLLMFTFLPTLTSIGLLVCYITNASAGGPHLAYGYVRDFMMPFWLLGLAAGPWNVKVTHIRPSIIIPLFIFVFYMILANLRYGLLDSYHISKIHSSLLCYDNICNIELTFINIKGHIIRLPFETTIIEQHCDSDNTVNTETIISS